MFNCFIILILLRYSKNVVCFVYERFTNLFKFLKSLNLIIEVE